MKYLLILDDGHGEETAGKRSPAMADGYVMKENYFNRAVVELLKAEAERSGIDVYLTAPELGDVSLSTRSSRANAKYNEYVAKYGKNGFKCIFISVHANAYLGTWGDWGGIDTFHYPGSTSGKALATIIQKYLIQGSPLKNRGVKEANFHVVRETVMPAVLVECGFMDSNHDINYLISDAYRKETAIELAKGACEYFGINYVPYVPPAPKPEPKEEGVLYKVQVGAYGVQKYADAMAAKVKAAGFPVYMPREADGLIKVQVGAYGVKANAEKTLAQLKAKGFNGYIKAYKK